MKKRRNSSATATAAAAAATVDSSAIATLKTLIRDHAVFFDNLVDLIPARFYLSTENQDKPWFQGLTKDAKQAAKRLSKENTKKSRRDRLDPDLASSKTTNQVLKESLDSEKAAKDSNLSGGGDGERVSVTYEELQKRLRKRLEELRAGRGGGGDCGGGQRREKKEGNKRKRNEEREKKDEEREKRENERDVIDKEASEAALDIEFGKVKLRAGVDDGWLNKKKRKKLSKEEELERAIKLEEAKKDPEKGEVVAKQHSWKTATERAMGMKVHDNPKLLKESMKKEKKKHKKSVEKWKERVEKTETMKREKQDKRKGNIQAKIDRKKQMKIEKREKKLMRPGFEGRKEGFVNGN